MGIKLPERRTTLVIQDYPGIEVEVVTSVPLSVLFEVDRLLADKDADQEASWARIRELFLERGLRAWNIDTDAGEPLTADAAGWAWLEDHDIGLASGLVAGWSVAAKALSAPLVLPSGVGGMSAPPEETSPRS